MVDKDTRKLLAEAQRQGFEVRYSGKGYPLVYKGGVFVDKAAQTPSDHRGQKNFIAKMRRHGFQWPPKR